MRRYLTSDSLFEGETSKGFALLFKYREVTPEDAMKFQNRRVLQLQHHARRVSEQKGSHASPLSSVRHLVAKAFGLTHLHGEVAASAAEDDDVPTNVFQEGLVEASTHCCGSTWIQQPGPSKPFQLTLNTKTETLERSPSFTEIKHWWKEEINCQYQDDDLELNYLADDSPLKGKDKAIWKKKEPDLDLWKTSGLPISLLMHPEPVVIQGRMKEREGHMGKSDCRSSKSTASCDDFEVRFHRRHSEADAQDDIIVRIEPKVKLRHNAQDKH